MSESGSVKLAYAEAVKSKESKEALKLNQHDISKSETELKQRELILESANLSVSHTLAFLHLKCSMR